MRGRRRHAGTRLVRCHASTTLTHLSASMLYCILHTCTRRCHDIIVRQPPRSSHAFAGGDFLAFRRLARWPSRSEELGLCRAGEKLSVGFCSRVASTSSWWHGWLLQGKRRDDCGDAALACTYMQASDVVVVVVFKWLCMHERLNH